MSVEILGWTALLSIVPISELRGAIPFAVTQGIHPVTAYFFAVFFNALVGPIVFIFLNSFHKLFWGVALFVAIPLPITGAWTGTLGAWIFGLKKRKTILAVILGVSISGLIVSLITFFGVEALSFLIKKV